MRQPLSVSKNIVVGADAHIGPSANVANLLEIAENRRGFLQGDVGIAPYDLKPEAFCYFICWASQSMASFMQS